MVGPQVKPRSGGLAPLTGSRQRQLRACRTTSDGRPRPGGGGDGRGPHEARRAVANPTLDSPGATSTRSRARHPGLPRRPPAPGADQVAAHRPGHEGPLDRPLARRARQRGLIRLHPGGRIEVVPPDISLPALALDYERRARETRSAAHELAQVYFQARSASRRPTSARCGSSTRWTRSPRSRPRRSPPAPSGPLLPLTVPPHPGGLRQPDPRPRGAHRRRGQRARLRERLRHRGPRDRRRAGDPRGAGARRGAVPRSTPACRSRP